MFTRFNSKLLLVTLALAGMVAWFFASVPVQAIQPDPYVWWQGGTPVRMVPSVNSACFLTTMRGKFEGSGEVIRVVQRDGYWYLEGDSKQRDVMAGARCIIGSPENPLKVSGPYSWNQDTNVRTRMFPIDQSACLLTEISGKFKGSGEAVRIEAGPEGYWWLSGTSKQRGVSAKAVCIKARIQGVSGEYRWHQALGPGSYRDMENSNCFLTMVSGKFMGWGEEVTIDYVPSSPQRFILWGHSKQKDVQAGARCIRC